MQNDEREESNNMQGETLAYRLEAVTKIAQKIGRASNLDEAIQAVAESACVLTSAESSIIYMQRPHCEGFEIVGRSPEEPCTTHLHAADRLTCDIVAKSSPITCNVQIRDGENQGEIAGVPIMDQDDQAAGALYVISNRVNHFNNSDIMVIQSLANLVPLAQGLPGQMLEWTETAETAAEKILEIDNAARGICEAVQEKFDFEFVAVQIVDRSERSISTVYGTGIASELVGLAKHPLDRISGDRDIQGTLQPLRHQELKR